MMLEKVSTVFNVQSRSAEMASTIPAFRKPLMVISGHHSMVCQLEMIQLALNGLIAVEVMSIFSLYPEVQLRAAF